MTTVIEFEGVELNEVCASLPEENDEFYTKIHYDIYRAMYVDDISCAPLMKLLFTINIYLYFINDVNVGINHFINIENLQYYAEHLISAYEILFTQKRPIISIDLYMTIIDVYNMILVYRLCLFSISLDLSFCIVR